MKLNIQLITIEKALYTYMYYTVYIYTHTHTHTRKNFHRCLFFWNIIEWVKGILRPNNALKYS